MHGGEKACWKTVVFEAPAHASASIERELGGAPRTSPSIGEPDQARSRQERLAALYRFQNGDAPAEVRLVDPRCGSVLTDPSEIDWTHFPMLDALEAVTRDELHRLRSLLRAEAPGLAGRAGDDVQSHARAPHEGRAPTPPNGLVWGVDLRRAPPNEPPTSEA